MINHWWVTRPKRKLNSVPEVLSTFAEQSLDQEWKGQRDTHLSLEEALEEAGLKRVGERRDHTGGGGRTYKAWLLSLGLIFTQECSKLIKLTLSGEAIMAGDSPVEVIKHQILKYQFPSAFSLSRGVNVSRRFKIRPFKFLLKLLLEVELGYYLTQDEIAKIIIIEAEDETDNCYKKIVKRIIDYRENGDSIFEADYFNKVASNEEDNLEKTISKLSDVSNTMINWIEYTQLAKRNDEKVLVILDEKYEEVRKILSKEVPFIDRPEKQEYFQRKFGVDPKHNKDTRNLTQTKTITHTVIGEQKVKKAFISVSLKKPIYGITKEIIEEISLITGLDDKFIEETLKKLYPNGAIGSFMTEYYEMAFKGRDSATEFEKATAELLSTVFKFEVKHVGPNGINPDIIVSSNNCKYIGIIDNKAYSKYTITNDHKNRMVHNYISDYKQNQMHPLAFFCYISGGFGKNIDSQIKEINKSTNINGSGITVSNFIKLIEYNDEKKYSHNDIKELLSLNRQVLLRDL